MVPASATHMLKITWTLGWFICHHCYDDKTESSEPLANWPLASDIHDITGGLYCCGLRSESPGWTRLPQGAIMKNFFSFPWCEHAKKGARAEDCRTENPPMQGLTGAQSRLYVWRSALSILCLGSFNLALSFFSQLYAAIKLETQFIRKAFKRWRKALYDCNI